MLNSKAAFEATFEVEPAAEEESFENPGLLGQNVFEGDKLNANINGKDQATNTQSRNEIKLDLRNKVQNRVQVQRQELRIHHESVHFICKLCGNEHVSKVI